MWYEMHISEITTNSNSTVCIKMTEEGRKKHGMNGNTVSSAPVIKEETPRNSYGQGGRLKFFKDGKFILELERAREGERVSWVSVNRKTFWPPQGTIAMTTTYPQESSTSLSDDNSSIPSSPWQRDHSWKQPVPQKNISKQLVFYYKRSKKHHPRSRKCRRPYDDSSDIKVLSVDSKNSECNTKLRKKKSTNSLQSIINILSNRSASSTPPRVDMLVSPRKRILRDAEKDKVPIDDLCQKRSKSKVQNNAVDDCGSVVKIGSPVSMTDVTEVRNHRNNSYSITSLLAEDLNLRRSSNNSSSHFSEIQNKYYIPPLEERWYSESVDKLGSIELSHTEKRSLAAFSHFSYVPQHVYPYPVYCPTGTYIRSSNMAPPMYNAPFISLPVKPDAPTCSWAVEPTRDAEHKDDNTTDTPLNLSKHTG